LRRDTEARQAAVYLLAAVSAVLQGAGSADASAAQRPVLSAAQRTEALALLADAVLRGGWGLMNSARHVIGCHLI
jgi:hypothetical protein